MLRSSTLLFAALLAGVVFSTAAEIPTAGKVKVTILSTMLADGPKELGEWGFSALVEVDGHRILFDTGAHTDVVLKNAQVLGVDLTNVPEVILSHSHWDHVGGLLTLRESVRGSAPSALATAHVGLGAFYSRHEGRLPAEDNALLLLQPEYERLGGSFVLHDKPVELYPGVWLTGPVPRHYPEHNWSGNGIVQTPAGPVEDNIPEDMSLVINTAQGLVIVTGCGHAGVVNIVEYARTVVRPAPVLALIGGIHLFSAKEETLAWTSGMLKKFGVANFIGAHCTGIETVYRLRSELGLDRKHAVVGAVGASYTLGTGIDPRNLAR